MTGVAHYGVVKDKHIRLLENITDSENVSTRNEELLCYSRDSTIFFYKPDVVVRPNGTEDVSKIMEMANRERIPVTPRGAGTSAAGLPLPVMGGILLDMCSMKEIELIDPENQLVVTQPGVICDALNAISPTYRCCIPPFSTPQQW